MNWLWSLTVALTLIGCSALQAAEDAPAINTIDELWAGYDPRALPLDVDVIKQTDDAGIRLETIYFTGELFEGEKTRIFGYYGRPARPTGKLPGILHIHGGGQTANLGWARYWAERGYCALSFDFCGDTNLPTLGPEYRRENFTRWGKVPADMMKVSGGRSMEPTPRHNPWFHWTMAARRGLTFLESQPHVDADRLGIFGISVGGTLTWIVAGVDSRVNVAAPIYGCGWESYNEFPPQPAAPVDRPTQLWRALIAPEAHAPRITCPVLFFNATDDFHGKMDLAYETLDRLPVATPRGQVFTANYDHHIEPVEARSLPLWMSAHLKGTPAPATWPATPRIEIAASDPMPIVRVAPANPAEVERVDIYYALNNDWPMTRFWRAAIAERGADGVFTASAPFLTADDTIYTFANVTCRSAIRLSSKLLKQPVKELAGARPTLVRTPLIDAMETAADWCWVPAYTDPNQGDTAFFEPWRGAGDEQGFTLDAKMFHHDHPMTFYFGTRKLGDPQYRASPAGAAADDPTTHGGALLIDVLAENLPETLTVRVKHRAPPQVQTEYEATWKLATDETDTTAAGAWRTLRMERERFHTPQGVELPDWEHVEYFILHGKSPARKPPVFKRLRWEK